MRSSLADHPAARVVTDPVPSAVARDGMRPCVRPGCARPAVVSLRFDYATRVVTIDPIAPRAEPEAYDLCVRHAARSGPPSGWTLRDRAPSRGPATDPAPPVGPSGGHGVDRLAAALCAVPGAVSEDAPVAVPPGADRSVPTRLHDLLAASRPVAAPAPAVVPVARAVRLTPDPRPDVWCAGLVPVGPAGPDGRDTGPR